MEFNQNFREYTDECTDEYNQGLYSDLTRAIRELTSVDDSDDTDACVQPPFDTYNQDKPLLENYRLVNFQSIRSSSSVSAGKEDALESHKRDVSWTFDLNQAALIDGSDRVTEEDGIIKTTTDVLSTTKTTISSATASSLTANRSTAVTSTPAMIFSVLANTTVASTIIPTMTIATSTTMPTPTIIKTTAMRSQVCLWTSWVPLTHCTPSCGPAFRILVRLCIVASTGQSCPTSLCGRGESQRNETCSCSPPCETITIIPSTADRDPSIRIISYSLPNTLHFFEQTYRRIWV
ncbi:unnamed protein product [Rotaria sp. Silwood2]|nr:unnamed protein product [Rotaria sp. Silwood2]